MNRSRFLQSLTGLALGGTLLCSTFTLAHALGNPTIRMADGVEYMSGGNNAAEKSFLQVVSPRWPLELEFAVNRSQQNSFPTDVKISVHDKYTGKPIMETTSRGPVMLLRLESGLYDVQAMAGGLTLTQSLTVFEGASSKAVFLWPSNVDFASLTRSSDQEKIAKKIGPGLAQIKVEPSVVTHDRQAAIAGEKIETGR